MDVSKTLMSMVAGTFSKTYKVGQEKLYKLAREESITEDLIHKYVSWIPMKIRF